uniref:Uncharacterized protein n=1 Tax=Solanum tuberosum TaxID=4113 RepID=M1DKJ0_SOLTU
MDSLKCVTAAIKALSIIPGIVASSLDARLSAAWTRCLIRSTAAWVSGGREAAALVTYLGGRGAIEELRVIEGAELEILKGLEAGVGNNASAGKVSMSTVGDESTEVAFYFLASSFKYSTSMRRMSLKEVGITSTFFFSSRDTRACLHNSVINTKNESDVWRCLALMAISYLMIMPKFIFFSSMMEPRQDAFMWRRIDSFWDDIIVLLMKPNQYLAATLRSFFSIGAPI